MVSTAADSTADNTAASTTPPPTPPTTSQQQINMMELEGPDRCHVSSSITVTAAGLAKLESTPLTAEIVGAKLEGCKACRIATLLDRLRPNLGNGISGYFTAADGVTTDPIPYADLRQGFVVHSDRAGVVPLQGSLGGPLRIIYPPAVAIQSSICGTAKPVNLKGCVKLTLASEYEVMQSVLAAELSKAAPSAILLLEETYGSDMFVAFARHFGGVKAEEEIPRVRVAGVDARGFTVCVTDASGKEDTFECLAPFPRPLTTADEIVPMALEMYGAAAAALGWAERVKLQRRRLGAAFGRLRGGGGDGDATTAVVAVAAVAALGLLLVGRRRA